MGSTPGPTRRISRKEAAQYVTDNYFDCSVAALAKYAWLEIGPPYLCLNGTGAAGYLKSDLDAWAPAFYKLPARKRKDKAA